MTSAAALKKSLVGTAVFAAALSSAVYAVSTGGRLSDIPDATPNAGQLRKYAASLERYSDIALKAGADVMISNHQRQDQSMAKLDLLHQPDDW